MRIRQAAAQEMLELWGYSDVNDASPTARFFYHNISAGNALFWTVDHEGELIGELYVFLDMEDKDYADGVTTAYLCAFRVQKEYRDRGLGTKMMKTALADLKDRGYCRATIGVDEERNMRLYHRLGFTTKVKDCYIDPCARDGNMRPEKVSKGYCLLSKNL